jgi:hypothetical protein
MNVLTFALAMFGGAAAMFGVVRWLPWPARRCATCGEEIDFVYCACAPRLTDTVRINAAIKRYSLAKARTRSIDAMRAAEARRERAAELDALQNNT